MKILFEVAHGNNVAGKCDPTKTFKEYLYSREIVPRIVHGLRQRGYDATNLVPELYEPGLDERAHRVNVMCHTYGKDECIFISVHVNASRKGEWGNARGWCCYTTPGTTRSDALAECLYRAAVRCFPGHQIRRDKSDGDSDWEKNFYVLRHTLCPAVLTENFFMDNKEDLAYLCSDEGKDAIVRCHVEGVISYLEELANG
jgi:N-acetylmuramoyl-L-alanine amidase